MAGRMPNIEFSIRGDELEQNRIQLEHNLQHTDLSLHLSSAPDDDCSDVEYPRHNSAPSPFSAFASFEQRSGDHFEAIEHSQYPAWSFRSFDQNDTVDPYAGETISTAAHHASALTLSAGLGGRGPRRDVSLSGAEYDPDRPLQGIMAGINSRLSALDMESVKSKNVTSNTVNFDPLVVDDTAELDRVLQSGNASIRPSAIRSPFSSLASSSSLSEPASPRSNSPSLRPKLLDALHAVSFSPKRPRSAQSHVSPRSHASTRLRSSPSTLNQPLQPMFGAPLPQAEYETYSLRQRQTALPLNGPSNGRQQSLSYVQADAAEVNVQPPTPPTENTSGFTRMARGLAQETETEQSRPIQSHRRSRGGLRASIAQSTVRDFKVAKTGKERNPFKDIANQVHGTSHPNAHMAQKSRTPLRSRVHLPDVTGLTSAVGSPAKVGLEYYKIDAGYDGENQARLFATLNAVQSKLAFLESENSISRRRVHELELELEACKLEVARERTKILEREELVAMRAADVAREQERLADLNKQARGKVKAMRRTEANVPEHAENESRYQEAVAEKKALEALITTLRSHLSRLTAELSEHQRLLTDLRSLRDSDVQALTEKTKDIDHLRQEVERLAGEIEVLRGVVEEGLKERRSAREQLSRELSPVRDDERTTDEQYIRNPQKVPTVEVEDEDSTGSEDEDAMSESSTGRSPTPSPRRRIELPDRTLQTDHATLGSSQPLHEMSTRPFIDPDEQDRISADIRERRSQRSLSSSLSSSPHQTRSVSDSHTSTLSRCPSPAQSSRSTRAASLSLAGSAGDIETDVYREHHTRASHAVTPADRVVQRPSSANDQLPLPSRPTAPTPAHALAKSHSYHEAEVTSGPSSDRRNNPPRETPFPQIRGAHMERLFFSAPEHNAQTCGVCHRRRKAHPAHATDVAPIPFWMADSQHYRKMQATVQEEDDDEGYVEGSEEDNRATYPRIKGKGKGHDRVQSHHEGEREVPPQTVLARVVRELEDDFTHYKSIYVELAEQYKLMDAASNVAKRNIVAGHLREVIDILEQKGDQIASLYDLLTFKDKPHNEPADLHQNKRPIPVEASSWGRARGLGKHRTVPIVS